MSVKGIIRTTSYQMYQTVRQTWHNDT